MRTTSIAPLLHSILVATVASGTAGCGGISLDGYEPLSCTGSEPDTVGAFGSDVEADYLALYARKDYVDPEDSVELVQSAGEPCATASDVAACEAAIASATSEGGFQLGQCVQVCTDYYLVVNRGDDVEVIDTAEGLEAFLGPIDSAGEAVMAAELAEYNVGCNDVERGGVKQVASGYEVIATKLTKGCDPVEVTRFQLGVEADGTVVELDSEVISSDSGSCVGRRPACHRARRATGRSALGAYLASVAHLEEAAVHAFAELRSELEHHGAPADLVDRAEGSRMDEVRHTRMMRRMASRFGGDAPRATAERQPPRCLEAFALHNAVEGCIRETFGALIGLWQATHADDRQLAEVMRAVADDETRHAQLSWDIHRWAMGQLDEAARARIEAAQREALAELLVEAREPVDEQLAHVAGLPRPAAHVALAERFAGSLAA